MHTTNTVKSFLTYLYVYFHNLFYKTIKCNFGLVAALKSKSSRYDFKRKDKSHYLQYLPE